MKNFEFRMKNCGTADLGLLNSSFEIRNSKFSERMQRPTILLITLAVVLACRAPESTQKVDTRDAIAIYYVNAPELKVHAAPSDQAAVVTRFLNGESAAVLSRRNDDWVEVRTANGSGWAHMSELGSADAAKQAADSPSPRFEKGPAPISAPSTHGPIYIEANVK